VTFNQAGTVIVDMQHDVIRGPWMTWWPDIDAIVAADAKLIEASRKHDVPVIYTVVEYKEDGSNTPVAIETGEPVSFGFLIEGTPGIEIIPELEPAPGEVIAKKNLISAFDAEGFGEAVEAAQLQTLILAGLQLEYGVLLTAQGAKDRGLDVVVVSDCCGASTKESFEQHINEIYPPIARVLTLEQTLAELGG
jgi:nicotinamidase-related amidase